MVACIIPARFNSVRYPGKLLEKIAGKTVLQMSLESALQCPEISSLYVATDDEKIASHVQGLGIDILWTSPQCQNGTARIIEALKSHKFLQENPYILNLQGDHPLITPTTVSEIISALLNDDSAVLATAVSKLTNPIDYLSPHTVKCVFDQSHNALYFSRSPIPYHPQGLPVHAFGHIGIYCYRTSFLLDSMEARTSSPLSLQEDLEQLRILENGYRIKVAVVNEEVISVDTPQDLMKLKEILCLRNISL